MHSNKQNTGNLMCKFIQQIFVAILFIMLTGCNTFFDKDNTQPPTPLKDFSATKQAKQLWQTQANASSKNENIKLIPALANNTIFTVSPQGTLTAINKETGKIIWQADTKQSITSGVTTNNSLIFIGTKQGYLLALNQNNGELVWKKNIASEILAPAAANNEVALVKSIDGNLTALSTKDGHQLWHFQEKSPDLILRGGSSPQIKNDSVFAGFENGTLVRLDLKSGKQIWQENIAEPKGIFSVQRMIDIDANPAVTDTRVFVVTWQGQLAALNISNGNIIWSTNASSIAGLAHDKDRIYLADQQGNIRAYNANDGKLIWQQNQLIARNLSSPAIIKNNLLVGDAEGWLHWINKETGQFVARSKASDSAIESAPLIENNIAYISTKNGQISKWTLN